MEFVGTKGAKPKRNRLALSFVVEAGQQRFPRVPVQPFLRDTGAGLAVVEGC